MYQNESLQAACDCNLLLEDYQLFFTTFKAEYGMPRKIPQNCIKIVFLTNTSYVN